LNRLLIPFVPAEEPVKKSTARQADDWLL
jgi:hypothetical protein